MRAFFRYKVAAVTALTTQSDALERLLPDDHIVASSVKVSIAGLSEGRRLYTIQRNAFAPQSSKRFMQTAEAFLGRKADVLLPWLDGCDVFHFGFDPGSMSDRLPVRKVYLELTAETPDDPGLTYLALKGRGQHLRRNWYHTIPMSDHAQADHLLATLKLAAPFQPDARALIYSILDGSKDCPTLLVTEDGTDRRSFDFNFADSAASGQVMTSLRVMLRRLGQPESVIDRLLGPPLCHAAMGVFADGSPFVTLYEFPKVANA